MKNDQSGSDRLAALLRDRLIGLIVLAMIGWLIYFGATAMLTKHLDLGRGGRLSHHWFTGPLNGFPAILAGLSFVSLAAAFLSLGTLHPQIKGRIPSWIPTCYGWLYAGFAVLYLAARFLSHS